MSKETPKKELEEVVLTTEEEIENLKKQIEDLKTEKKYISEAYNSELKEKQAVEESFKKKIQAKDLELNELRKRISQEHNAKEDKDSLNERLKRTQEGERIRISQLQKMMKLTGGMLNSLQSQLDNLAELYNYQVDDIQNTYKN